ncbi:hypothetical protein CTA2_6061 [Colletotrichum tanaceti]|nr:hypothetical protein CTA2_6061 [Colletotrichum tanaceti]
MVARWRRWVSCRSLERTPAKTGGGGGGPGKVPRRGWWWAVAVWNGKWEQRDGRCLFWAVSGLLGSWNQYIIHLPVCPSPESTD